MKKEMYLLALDIVSNYHTTKLTINPVKANGQVGELPRYNIVIHECCASVVDNLKAHGFSMSMHNNALSVYHYGV